MSLAASVLRMASTHESTPDERNGHVEIYIDGDYYQRDEAKISVFDSAFLVGDGIWEGIRLHEGRLAFVDRHLDRLYRAAKRTLIDVGLEREQMETLLYEVCDRNEMHDGVHVRLMVSRGTKKTPSQHPSNLASGPTIVIIPEYKMAVANTDGVKLHTASVRRPPPNTLDQRLNIHSKLHEVMALNEAVDAGADEALMLDIHGNVATCNATNFFCVSDGEVWTSSGLHCLPGVTRQAVIESCADVGVPVHIGDFDLGFAHGADEAFVTGTFAGLTSVASIDGNEMAVPGPITGLLADAYRGRLASDVAGRERP